MYIGHEKGFEKSKRCLILSSFQKTTKRALAFWVGGGYDAAFSRRASVLRNAIQKVDISARSNILRDDLSRHHLLVFRDEDFRVGPHGAQGFRVGEALGFLAVDADDFLQVAGDALDVAF